PVLLVAADPQRRAAMGAEFVDHRIAPLRVAPGDEPLRQELNPYRRTLVFGQFACKQCRQPVAAEEPAHGRAGTGLGEEVVLFFPEHWRRPCSQASSGRARPPPLAKRARCAWRICSRAAFSARSESCSSMAAMMLRCSWSDSRRRLVRRDVLLCRSAN